MSFEDELESSMCPVCRGKMVQEVPGLHLLRALKEGSHKPNPRVGRDSRGTTPEGNIFLVCIPLGNIRMSRKKVARRLKTIWKR